MMKKCKVRSAKCEVQSAKCEANAITRDVSRFTFHVSRPTHQSAVALAKADHALSPTPRSPLRAPHSALAFTLIELLVVIAVISLLAAMIIPITGAVNRNKIRAKSRAELAQIETAIENYKTKLGHYPPDNPGKPSTNQLYFELLGTTNTGTGYQTLDGSANISAAQFLTYFGPNVTGFVNCSQGAGDEARGATDFLPGLKPGQVGQPDPNAMVKFVVCSINWQSLGGTPWYPLGVPNLNPISYNSSNPTNNPRSYDLWMDIVVAGKTNRICNWSKEPLVVGTPW